MTAMRWPAPLVLMLLVACNEAQPAVRTPSSPAAAACRVPISITDVKGNLQGAFMTYPGGAVTIDAAGVGGDYYDAARARWLPVPSTAVAADGSGYVYTERKVPGTAVQARLHVVDVSTGGDKVYALGSPTDTAAFVVVQFAPEGIWLSYAGYESPRGGLFLLDLTNGALHDVGGQQAMFNTVAGGSGVFWFTDGGPNPQTSTTGLGGQTIQARVQRFTVSDGKTQAWFTRDGANLAVLGADLAGDAIITDASTVWLARSPSDAKPIELPQDFYQAFADKHGIWFGGRQGIYLYTEAGGVQRVSTQEAVLAGACA